MCTKVNLSHIHTSMCCNVAPHRSGQVEAIDRKLYHCYDRVVHNGLNSILVSYHTSYCYRITRHTAVM